MDTLRRMSMSSGTVALPRVRAFHEAFMRAIRTHGRIHEIELVSRYKFKTKTFLEDMGLAKEMFSRGRIRLMPERIRGLKEVRTIVDKAPSEG